MLDKIKNFFKKAGIFFTSLFNLASYTEHQNNVINSLNNLTTVINNITEGLTKNTEATNALTQKMIALEGEINKIKDGLQIELFGSLQALHARLFEQHYATQSQKREAELYYNQIHNLGKDGWSFQYYNEILHMPESREEYWKQLNETKG